MLTLAAITDGTDTFKAYSAVVFIVFAYVAGFFKR